MDSLAFLYTERARLAFLAEQGVPAGRQAALLAYARVQAELAAGVLDPRAQPPAPEPAALLHDRVHVERDGVRPVFALELAREGTLPCAVCGRADRALLAGQALCVPCWAVQRQPAPAPDALAIMMPEDP
jgi:hypothetical protein